MLKHPDSSNLKQLPWWTISIGAVALLIHFVAPPLSQKLQMDQSMVFDGAWWQLISGHLTHWNSEHLWADLAVFAVIGSFIERKSAKHFVRIFLLSSITISLGVILFNPEINSYRGLSGIDMAMAAFWTADSLRTALQKKQIFETTLWIAGLAGILCKPLVEIILGHPIFVQDLGSNVVGMPIPHIVGATTGIFLMLTTVRPGLFLSHLKLQKRFQKLSLPHLSKTEEVHPE